MAKTQRTKAPLETFPCNSRIHSADPAVAAMGRRSNGGDTCKACNNTGTATRCSRCLFSNCDGIKYCPACATCDDTGTVGCLACEAQGGDEDGDCSRCEGSGRVPCTSC